MESPVSVASELNCTQCGGTLHPDEGQAFLTCPYCGATVYVDKSRVVFHWYVAPTLNDQQATAALYRWMSGSQTVKDLDKKAQVTGQSFQYFPIWYFRRPASGKEEIVLQPAAATSVTELAHLNLPAGDLRKYETSIDSQAIPPTVPLQSALEWNTASRALPAASPALPVASPAASAPGAYSEASLVHVPLYFFKYEFNDGSFTAIVDAASGTVLANLFPPKQEAPYLLVGGVTALVYLSLALAPLALGETGIALCTGGGLLAAPFLFGWAYWVASKV